MLQRKCAGGVVFSGEKLLLLRNDKNEWVLPKGLVPAGALSYQVAVDRVAAEAGVSPVEVVCPAGETRYANARSAIILPGMPCGLLGSIAPSTQLWALQVAASSPWNGRWSSSPTARTRPWPLPPGISCKPPARKNDCIFPMMLL